MHQLSKEEKDAVPEHVRLAALEMGKEAFLERLRAINMTPFDAAAYNTILNAVRAEVLQLKTMLGSLQSKGQDRAWLRNQTMGDLDDARLVEGLTLNPTLTLP